MLKKLMVIGLLSLSLMFFGCSKQETLSSNSFLICVQNDVSGGISQKIEIPTLKDEILKQNSSEKFENYLSVLSNNVEQKLYNNYYLKYWLRYLESPNKNYIIGGENVKFLRPQISEDKNKIYFSLNFLTADAWKFYSQNISTTTKKRDEKIFFLKKVESESAFPFDDIELRNYYFDVLSNAIKTSEVEINLSDTKIFFSYGYITPYGKIKSNADQKFETQNGYVHIWQKDQNSITNKEIKIWVNNINYGLWYLIVFVIFFVISTVWFSIFYIKAKTKQKNSKHT